MKSSARIAAIYMLRRLTLLANRTPKTSDDDSYSCRIASYRDTAISGPHFAGLSEWERHSNGEEVATVLDGQTTMTALQGGNEVAHSLTRGDVLIVPENTWHRFESENGVKIVTVTLLPTTHSVDFPV